MAGTATDGLIDVLEECGGTVVFRWPAGGVMILASRVCAWLAMSTLAWGCAVKATALDPATAETHPPLEIVDVHLVGVTAVDEERLRDVLQTQPSSWWPWAADRMLDRGALAADLRRIEAFYADHGYPDARVVAHDVVVDRDAAAATVTIHVEEGVPVRLAEIVLSGFTPLESGELADLRDQLPLHIGDPIVHVDVVTSGEMAADVLRDQGYPYAEVEVRHEPAAEDARRVHFEAKPGPIAWFGDIEIVGNRSVGDDIIRRELLYRPGDLFERRVLQESHRRLYELGLFRFANIEAVDVDTRPSEVKTRITVAESKHKEVQFSVGYGTEEKLRGDVLWRNVNFLGGARALTARGGWSSINRGAELGLRQPYVLHPRLSLRLEGHTWKGTEPAYELTTRGGGAHLRGEVDAVSWWTLSAVAEDHRSRVSPLALADASLRDELIALGLDPETGRQRGLLTALVMTIERDTARNPLDARDGYQIFLELEQAGSWLPGTFDFFEWRVGGRHYWPIGDRAVVASRLQAATIDPANTSAELPFAQRYFLGGSTSLRGWGRYEVSPLSANGLPLGGKSMAESALELRARIVGDFGAAFFVDAGNVWRDEWQFDLGDLRADAGAGVRYDTRIGPVRADVAWQLTPIDGLRSNGELKPRRWRIHFSIGQAF